MVTIRDVQDIHGVEVRDSDMSDDPQVLIRLQSKKKITEAAAAERYKNVWNRSVGRSSARSILHLLFPSLGR